MHGKRINLTLLDRDNTSNFVIIIRESVNSLCRDGADLPRVPYIEKACTRLNGEGLRGLTMVLK